jgi:hypothetical protein
VKYLPLFHHFKAIYQFPKHIIFLVKIVANASLSLIRMKILIITKRSIKLEITYISHIKYFQKSEMCLLLLLLSVSASFSRNTMDFPCIFGVGKFYFYFYFIFFSWQIAISALYTVNLFLSYVMSSLC